MLLTDREMELAIDCMAENGEENVLSLSEYVNRLKECLRRVHDIARIEQSQ